jgi:flagellar hook-associated protein 1 FlgK
MTSILSIGVSGLSASQSAIATTGNNISNANTDGYSRQRVELAPQTAQYTGAGYLGSGVRVESVQRIVDQFYISQLRSDTATFHELDSYSAQISQMDSLLADSSTGLSSSLQTFFSDLQQAAQDPTSIPVRQVVLSDASGLEQRFSTLYERFQSLSQSVSQRFDALTSQVTTLSQNIAKLNKEIVDQSSISGAQPNSLLDQREELLRQLSEVVGVNVVKQSDGMANVFMGNGQPLVIGNTASTLATRASSTDPSQQVITLNSGSVAVDVTSFVTGGSLGGLVKFQNGTLNNAYNALGQIAITVADAMNTQHKLGVDLNGNAGTNLFTDINSVTAMGSRGSRASTNTGTDQPTVFIANASKLTTSDYKLSFTSATAYTLTRLSDNTIVSSGALVGGQTAIPAPPSDVDGFRIQISATPTFAAGDSFSILPTRQGALNFSVALQLPEELALAQPIRTDAALTNTGGGVVSQGVMVPQFGAATAGASFNVTNPLSAPLLVRFTSATAYQILDNTNPAAPVPFATPLTGTITAGQSNIIQINNAGGVAAYQITLSGNPATGDRFAIAANTSGSSDNRNALALANLNLAKTTNGLSFSDAYGKLVSGIGATTASLKNSRDAANTLMAQAQASRDSVSAVNLDEEAANLIKFQQAYSASAQVITIARSLFTTLLGAFQ